MTPPGSWGRVGLFAVVLAVASTMWLLMLMHVCPERLHQWQLRRRAAAFSSEEEMGQSPNQAAWLRKHPDHVDPAHVKIDAAMDHGYILHPLAQPCAASEPVDLLIGVLTAPNDLGARRRQTLRKSWMQLPTGKRTIRFRFLLSLFTLEGGNVTFTDDLVREMKEHRDFALLEAPEAYSALTLKVEAFFKWAAAHCGQARYVLKTDDDSLVRVDRLAEELDVVPSERLYWGYRMDNMPVISDPRHRNAEGKGFPLKTYPPYMSGAGYILSRDVVMALAHAHLPYITMTNEDAALGTRLWGYDIVYKHDDRFRPWGGCNEASLLIHNLRQPFEIYKKIERVQAGRPMCGEPLSGDTVCARIGEGGTKTVACPKGKTVSKVLFASYGTPLADCADSVSDFEVSKTCHHKDSESHVTSLCLGKPECELTIGNAQLGDDPCFNTPKYFVGAFQCA